MEDVEGFGAMLRSISTCNQEAITLANYNNRKEEKTGRGEEGGKGAKEEERERRQGKIKSKRGPGILNGDKYGWSNEISSTCDSRSVHGTCSLSYLFIHSVLSPG